MRFNCGESFSARMARLEGWHLWFAWRPIRVGENDWRWLEYVGRKGTFWECWGAGGWIWEFRAR